MPRSELQGPQPSYTEAILRRPPGKPPDDGVLQLLLRLDLMTTEPGNTFNPLAALMGWVVPGLGHWIIGEKGRGALILGGVVFLWASGLLIGGIDSVDKTEDKLWFYAQAGSGPIAFVVDGLNDRLIKSGSWGEMLDAPKAGRQVSSYKSIAQMNEYGTLFTALAGLMNVVALLDAGSRPGANRRQKVVTT